MGFKSRKVMQPGYITDYNLIEEYRNFNPEGYEQYKNEDGTLNVPFDEYQRFLKSEEYQNFLRSEEELSSWEWYWKEIN